MKIKRVLRYYCEFCKKSGCSKHTMEQHEIYCTMNPNRKCRMCKIRQGWKQTSMVELIAISHKYKDEKPEILLNEFAYLTNHCPACMLAAFRQSELHSRDYSFDYQLECKLFWDKVNEENAERELQTW